jgi:outer membrane protein OmpA-like peptidoglycan-associated protein
MVFAGVALFLLLGIVGSCFYVGWRVKNRIQEFASGRSGSGKQRGAHSQASYQKIEPCPAIDAAQAASLQQATAAAIPLKAGLTLVKIWGTSGQDVESLTQVRSVDRDSLNVVVSAPKVVKGHSEGMIRGERSICFADLEDGNTYMTQAGEKEQAPQVVRGTTQFSLSRAEFNRLKSDGAVPMTYIQVRRANSNEYAETLKLRGTLKQVETQLVPFSVIVNGQKMFLPTIHARGTLGKLSAEMSVLNDVANPLMLEYMIDEGNFLSLRIMKISYPAEKKLETDLKEQGRAEVYGIYFDFNSDQLRPESAPVLQDIAEALRNNPDWKLRVGGHTDNVGGDRYNLDLSNRRAAAVKQALVEHYQIAPERLTPVGFGASQPKASNDTVEGRALNRRVELVRQ